MLASHLPSPPGVVVTDCDYALMNMLNSVFPSSYHILCRWHVGRSVHTRCRSHFSSRRVSSRQARGASAPTLQTMASNRAVADFVQGWQEVVLAESVGTYRTKWRELQSKHRRETSLLDYLRNTWLPLKEHIMAAWVNQHLHLGAIKMSRVEGFHAILKQVLGVSPRNCSSLSPTFSAFSAPTVP
jgi:hypothetical protein